MVTQEFSRLFEVSESSQLYRTCDRYNAGFGNGHWEFQESGVGMEHSCREIQACKGNHFETVVVSGVVVGSGRTLFGFCMIGTWTFRWNGGTWIHQNEWIWMMMVGPWWEQQ
jgi:hypothetical protein